jgi:nitrile hydratase
MDGVSDMGGMDGFGKVEVEANEPTFHAPWEGRVMALQRAIGFAGGWNTDMSRYAQERLPPSVYLSVSYYKRWALAMEFSAVERGLIGADELAAGHALRPGKPLKRKLTTEEIDKIFRRRSYERETNRRALFKVGDRVRARNIHPKTHTRIPRYVRGHVGEIILVHGCHVFPDTVALDLADENPQWLYNVRFQGSDLWGADSDPTLTVSLDLFEPYLDRA